MTYSPGEQGMQAVRAAAWRLPAGQRVHLGAPRKRSLPSVQATHAPEASSWVCSSHSEQTSETSSRREDGDGQRTHPLP